MTTAHRTPRHSFPATPLVVGLLIAASCLTPAGEAIAQVQSVTVKKNIEYVQTSPTTVVPAPITNGYGFGADVDGVNIGSIPAPILTGPINVAGLGSGHNNGRLVYVAGDSGWRWGVNGNDFGTSSLASLNSFFGSGTYTITVNGTPISLNLSGDAFPNAPVLALTGGNWVNGKYEIDPAQPLTITTSAFTAYGSHADDFIGVGAFGPGIPLPFAEIAPFGCGWMTFGKCQYHSTVPGSNTVTYTVPPNTFAAGQEYMALGAFSALVDVRPNAALPGSVNAALYEVSTAVTVSAVAPIFPMVVTGSITPTVANIQANIQYRPQDVGTTGSVYVFAVAPADIVRPAANGSAFTIGKTIPAGGSKADSVACVLAQLNGSGQLQAVSPSSLTAYITGVLSAQGQAVTILNGVPTVNIGGATFYVGYGTSSAAMINSGINRSAVTAPGTRVCKPQPPQTGWWWNPAESGRGFSIEASGNTLFMAAYLYDVSGRSTWHVATGPTSIDGSVFNGQLLSFGNGATLTGAYRPNTQLAGPGPVSLTFDDDSHGTVVWPGGTVAIQRFPVSATGPATAPLANQPESGWWWGGTADSGRGFFIEWQGANAFLAGYMYDAAGNATWYVAQNAAPITNPQSFQGTWLQLANGQTLTGPYRAPSPATSAGQVTIQFQGPDTAVLTLPSGTLPLRRFRF